MKNMDEQKAVYKKLGFVTRDEAAEITGRAPGGTNHELYTKHGVVSVAIPLGDKGRMCYLYKRDDLSKVPVLHSDKIPGRGDNGGKLMHEIKTLKQRLDKVESWIENLEA